MDYRQIAKLIPAKFRKEILQTNAISKAVAVRSNPSMQYLGIIYNDYISEEDLTCSRCLARVLHYFKEIEPDMVQLQKEETLLKEL